MESALVAVRNAVNRPQGLTRLAVDDLVENLAVMAEMGRLQSGIHYLIPQDQQQVTIRLDSCLAEYRRFHRETQLDGELLDKGAYQKQIRENQERNGYVLATSQAVRFSDLASRKRAVIIDPERAEDVGLDLSGFIVEDD